MHKIKNVFQRSQKLKTEERRPQQFVKRHTSLKNATIVETPVPDIPAPPSIDLAELSEMERPMYESWWKDLDPFNLQTINNETVLKFLNGCALEDNKLEQILALFDSVKDGLNKYQFFAMLRLIAHAQNGRKISRALIYLGAPVPHFNTNAIDAIIKTIPENDSTPVRSDRKSWWGYEKQPQLENRRSYMGPFTAHTPIPSTPTPFYNNDNNLMDYFYNNNDALTPSWNNTRPALTNSITTPATIIPVTPNNKSAEEKQQLTHSRSRSAGTATDIINTTNPYHTTTTTTTTEEELPQLQSSRSSLSLNELNTGSSLLLTQKFVYQSPSVRNRELNVNNPFNIPSYEDLQLEKHKEDIKSPFDDENSEEDDSYPNNKPNAQNILPPPVPNQSTKPAFPKYTRTNTFLIKRSQSTAADKRPSHLKHSRHKSTSATENVFY